MDLPHQPFRFVPRDGADGLAAGPAFTITYRLFASALASGCALWFAKLYMGAQIHIDTAAGVLYVLGGLAVLVITVMFIWRSQTTLAADKLTQTWMGSKQMATRDMVYAKLFCWRGLTWLIAPRLYARSADGKFASFYLSTPQQWDEAAHLVSQLQRWRADVMKNG